MDKFAMIIFGASGDLTKRKLMPALYSSIPRQAVDRRIFHIGYRAYRLY